VGELLLLDGVANDIRKNKGVYKALAKILYKRRHITANGGGVTLIVYRFGLLLTHIIGYR
jgi:hypothetical protein